MTIGKVGRKNRDRGGELYGTAHDNPILDKLV